MSGRPDAGDPLSLRGPPPARYSGPEPVPGSPVLPDTLTFIGTATTVLRIGSSTLLTDPNFLHRGQRAYLGRLTHAGLAGLLRPVDRGQSVSLDPDDPA